MEKEGGKKRGWMEGSGLLYNTLGGNGSSVERGARELREREWVMDNAPASVREIKKIIGEYPRKKISSEKGKNNNNQKNKREN
jgi:hypothetical protein